MYIHRYTHRYSVMTCIYIYIHTYMHDAMQSHASYMHAKYKNIYILRAPNIFCARKNTHIDIKPNVEYCKYLACY